MDRSGYPSPNEANQEQEEVENDYERERAAAEERDSAQLEAQARKERERLNALQNGPTIDEIAAGDTERTEDYDYGATREHWGTVQGFAESMQTLSDRRADTEVRVRKMIEQLSASGAVSYTHLTLPTSDLV